jgi:hypothetical protein
VFCLYVINENNLIIAKFYDRQDWLRPFSRAAQRGWILFKS